MADKLPNPESREETFLAKAAGESVTLPTPESRKELFLNAIAQGGGGGGSTINVVQTTGTSTEDVMSQKAVTDALAGAGGSDGFNIQPVLENLSISSDDYIALENSIINGNPIIARDDNDDPDFRTIRSSFFITSYVLNKVADPEADMRDITLWGFDEMGQYFQAMIRWNSGDPTVDYNIQA